MQAAEQSTSARETRTLEILDALVQEPAVRRELDAIVDRLEARLAAERSELLVWKPIPLSLYGVTVPPGIQSSWVFVLTMVSTRPPGRAGRCLDGGRWAAGIQDGGPQ